MIRRPPRSTLSSSSAASDVYKRQVAAGAVAVEYRMRCFLGPESMRAVNALALAAEAGRFDELRREPFAAQPPEHTGGFTTEDLLDFGRRAGMASPDYAAGVREGRYEAWAQEIEEAFQEQDPQGTPAALIDGQPVDPGVLYDGQALGALLRSLSLIHISEPTRLLSISYAVFCLKKK